MLRNCTPTIHKIDMMASTHTRNGWGTPGVSAFTDLLTNPESIRCVEIRSHFTRGTAAEGVMGLRSDSNLYATWMFLHSSDVRSNRFEDIVFWSPGGMKQTGWETFTSLPAGTSGQQWSLDVRIWRLATTAQLEGWVSNPYTSMDQDNRPGSLF